MPRDLTLEIRALTKTFTARRGGAPVHALRGVSLDVRSRCGGARR